MSIPQFPKFKPLSWEDKAFFESHTKNHEPYSDFNFVSIWGYGNISCAWSVLEDNIIVKMIDYHNQKPFLSFFGNSNLPRIVPQLIEYAIANGLPPELRLVPDVFLGELQTATHDKLVIAEDPDNHDYVLDLDLVGNMNGNYYANKRHELNRFYRSHSSYQLNKDIISADSKYDHVGSIFDEWTKKRGKGSQWENEFTALNRVLSSAFDRLYLYTLVIEDIPVGFSIIETLENSYSMLHYWKSTDGSEHGYTYMLHAIAKDLTGSGVKFLNMQQDIGKAELRHAKTRWHPVKMLKKHIIRFK